MRIPKIIHYCWFGNGPKDALIQNCMKTWQDVLPDFQIKAWTEEEIKGLDNLYLRQALERRKWAFASDYVRLYALYQQGGVYLDTDVEILRPLDDFLSLDFFIGSETADGKHLIGTGVIGAVAHNPIIGDMLRLYDNIPFIKKNGKNDETPNTTRLIKPIIDNGAIKIYDEFNKIKINDSSYVFPLSYFSLKSHNSYAVHHFNASWVDDYKYKHYKIINIFGKKIYFSKYKALAARADILPLENGRILLRIKRNKKHGFFISIT